MLLAHSLKLKEGPVLVKRNKMFGSQFFLQVKYETQIGFGLQKPMKMMILLPLLSHLSIVIQFVKRSSVTGIVLQLK